MPRSAHACNISTQLHTMRQGSQLGIAISCAVLLCRERIAEYNEHLSNLSEHHDIPKVGPG